MMRRLWSCCLSGAATLVLFGGGNAGAAPVICTYAISPGGQAFLAAGGNGTIQVIAPAGCPWTASGAPAWVTITSTNYGIGNSSIHYQVTGNTGGDRSGTLTIANLVFAVEQASNTMTGASDAGSMAQIAAAGGWKTTITLINTGAGPAQARLNFFDDSGNPLPLPLYFPQSSPAAGPLLASTLDRTLDAGAVLVIESTGPDSDPLLVGWGHLLANGSVGGFAIFTETASHQEAVVPLETRNPGAYLLAFDDTGGVATGLAIANVGTQSTRVPVIIRDDTGTQTGFQAISLGVQQHTSLLLAPSYAATAGVRGTLEFDTPVSARISVLGLRANGTALTTLPLLANVAAGGGSMAQVASGGGWKTIFTLVNADTIQAQATVSFFDDSGNPLALPLRFPQTGTSITATTVTRALAPGSVLVMEAEGPAAQAVVVGSARMTTTGKIGGFAIFRDGGTGQEAVVPLETRNASGYVLAFDNANGLATGLALANLSGQAVNVAVVLRDDKGVVLGTPTISLAAGGHTSFLLALNYAATAGKRGTVEFDAPAGAQITALGLRATPAGTLTTVPVLVK